MCSTRIRRWHRSEIVSGGAPNYYEFYDGLGRQLYLAMTAKF